MPSINSTVQTRVFRRSILAFHRRCGRPFPWRQSRDRYAVLIGELLLQRTRAEHVEPVYHRFLGLWPEPASLAEAEASDVAAVLRPLGLAKRAALLVRLGRELVAIGEVPATPARLKELPGVGPYTAHAVPIFSGNRNLPLVDWVIARVLRRYFGLPSERRPNADHELWELAAAIAATGRARDLWLGTLDLAAAFCKRRPLCDRCPLSSACAYRQRAACDSRTAVGTSRSWSDTATSRAIASASFGGTALPI